MADRADPVTGSHVDRDLFCNNFIKTIIMELNTAFGVYIVQMEHIYELDSQNSSLQEEMAKLILNIGSIEWEKASYSKRMTEIHELIKRNNEAINRKVGLVTLAKHEIVQFLKSIKPTITFPIKEVGTEYIHHFELDQTGNDIIAT
jgi:hypothetical protein